MTTHLEFDDETLAAYALHALPAPEHAAATAHLDACARCRAEVDGFVRAAAAMAADVAPVQPSPQLRRSVLDAVSRTSQQTRAAAAAPVRSAPGQSRSGRSSWSWSFSPLAAAAAVLLVAVVGLGSTVLGQQRELEIVTAQAARIERLLADPDRRTVDGPVRSGGTATALVAQGEAVVVGRNLAGLPADRAYQVWVVDDGAVRSGGLLPAGERGALVDDVAGAEQLMLSVEPAQGSQQPTTSPIWSVRI